MTKKIKIWAVSEGPVNVQDLIDKGEYPYIIPKGCKYFTVCKVEENDRIIEKEFWFPDEEDAYYFKNFIDKQMEAVEVDDPGLPEMSSEY